METRRILSIYEIVGRPLCVTADDGQKVFQRCAAALAARQTTTLSFRQIAGLTPTFLHAAIGQLYGVFSPEEIRARLTVTDLAPDDLAVLTRVVDTAKAYFSSPVPRARV